MSRIQPIVILASLLISPAVFGAVQITPNGFVVSEEVVIDDSPAKVYQTLFDDVGRWWNPEHTYSGDSKNLTIEQRAGGCFCEKLANGGGVEHMRVVILMPADTVVMSGALGPLRYSGLAGSMTWKFVGTTTGTRLQFSYVVGGFMQGGFEKMAPAVNEVLSNQLHRLKLYVETGSPIGK